MLNLSLPIAVLALAMPAAASAPANPPAGAGLRRLPLAVPQGGQPGFTALPGAVTGVRFTNLLSQTRYLENMNLLNGSGVALGDFDGDGLCDIYLCRLEGPNALYRNRGRWRFEDVTDTAGVACADQLSTGAAFADVNGDGWLDLLVNSMGGPNALFLNTGRGTFTNVTAAAGLVSELGSTSLALADVDGDGDLDLYVANYGVNSILRSGGQLSFRMVGGRPVATGRHARRIRFIGDRVFELGEPDVLYLNDGQGRFTPVSWTDGAFLDEEGRPLREAPWDQSLSALFHDFNGDRAPDLYVCGDASTPDRFWLNDGRGRFRAVPGPAVRVTPYFSMSVVAADLDRDGLDDLFVTDMLSRQHVYALTQRGTMHDQPRFPGDLTSRHQTRRNVLLHARGDGTYEDLAWYAEVAGSEWAWSCLPLDVDLDGWEDLFISNGHIHNADDQDTQERIRQLGRLSVAESRKTALLFERLDTPNLAYHNLRNLTFRECGQAWGFDSRRISHGMALGDLDGDGDLDVVINCFGDEALVLRNDCPAPRLAVRLRGRPPNTRGIGARLRVTGGPVPQEVEMTAGGRYMSGDEPLRVFATGPARRLTLEVFWRAGGRSVVPDAEPNHLYEIEEPETPAGQASANPGSPTQTPARSVILRDGSNRLAHRHAEAEFDDFAQQPLLPYRLSRLGPGAGWFDLDGDDRAELIVAGDAGGRVEVFRYESAAGRFVPLPADLPPLPGDGVAVAGWTPAPGRRQALVGLANQAAGETNPVVLIALEWREGRVVPAGEWRAPFSAGAVAVGDCDGDGDLDVFVGGRFVPGRYPEPADSRLYRNEHGQLVPDPASPGLFSRLGRVSGAVWADVDQDGRADLVLATEWGPVRLFLNRPGALHEATAEWGLAARTGLWSGLGVGDFDGDGYPDLIAGNWGLNSPYRAAPEQPLRLYFGDLDENGVVDLIEAYDVPGLGIAPRRDLDAVAAALPFLKGRFASRKAYAQAPLRQILGTEGRAARELQVTTLATTVFLNRTNRFEAVPLPPPAQWAPVFGVAVADLDGDGHQDLVLAQNLQATREGLDRLDAGRGLVLRGDGRGGFSPLPGQESGLVLYGEQRACAVADFDEDARPDLVLTQNGADTALFQNAAARPGVRVRLKGPPANPDGVGALVRLEGAGRLGPARVVTAGSGLGSQDDVALVLTLPGVEPEAVQVRWPGGRVTTHPFTPGAREVRAAWK